MLIDTHCHLNDRVHFPDIGEEVSFARHDGVERIIVVGIKPDEWEYTVRLTERYPELFCILGWHPNYTADYSPKKLIQLEELLRHPKALALGEIGLDYHWTHSPRETQDRALKDQLDLAESLEMPVVFHARDAYSDLLDRLEVRPLQPYLFHCFAGNAADAKRAVALDAYFGVDGPISYKKADDLRTTVKTLPLDRLVVETDAPYLPPEPYRGKQNRPAYVKHVATALANALLIKPAECADLTTANAVRFFGEGLK